MDTSKSLEKIGLTSKQAHVYVANLELGNGTALQIAHKSNLPKSTVADLLQSLSKLGLVSSYKKGNKKFYAAADPSVLQEKLASHEHLLSMLLPELRALYLTSAKKPRVRYYDGESGLQLVMNEVLKEASELLAIGSANDIFRTLSEYFPKFSLQRSKAKIPLRAIFRDSPKAHERQALDKQQLRQTKIIKTEIPFSTLNWIWQNKIALVAFKQNFSIVVIEDKEITQTFRALFEYLWQDPA
jgi:sugar-specific transcriptional regulator TrmB